MLFGSKYIYLGKKQMWVPHYVGEEEEEDLFVFKDTIEGPRAPAVEPGRVAT